MTWLIVVLGVVALVVAVVAVSAYLVRRQRSAALRRRFGPEYARVLDEHGDRRAAEAQLRHRLKQRQGIDLVELSPAARQQHESRWRALQAGFVDDPPGSVSGAVALVEEVMDERGYTRATLGSTDGDSEPDAFEVVAVDHPHLVEQHRSALGLDDSASIDDLREAFLHHRALFRALLGDGPAREPETSPADRGGDAAVVWS